MRMEKVAARSVAFARGPLEQTYMTSTRRPIRWHAHSQECTRVPTEVTLELDGDGKLKLPGQ